MPDFLLSAAEMRGISAVRRAFPRLFSLPTVRAPVGTVVWFHVACLSIGVQN